MPWYAWRRSRADRPALFHDLHCVSGYGDRITDLWAALTIARLLEPGGLVAVRWKRRGRRYQGFVGAYSTDLFSVADCEFMKKRPRQASRVKGRHFDDTHLIDDCIVQLPSGTRQIILRTPRHGETTRLISCTETAISTGSTRGSAASRSSTLTARSPEILRPLRRSFRDCPTT